MIDFSRFEIVGADGNRYVGVRPSLVPKPFRSICYKCDNGLIIYPTTHPNTEGFDGSLNVITNGKNETKISVRLICILKDGRKMYNLYTTEGKYLSSGEL